MHTDVHSLFCVYYRLSGFVCVAYSISDHANLYIDCYLHVTVTFLDMCWRVCSLSRGKALRKVGWRWDEGRWLCLAGSFWLLWGPSDWEDGSRGLTPAWLGRNFWVRFEVGVGLKGIVPRSSLVDKEAGHKTGSFLLGWKCLFSFTLTSHIHWGDGMGWGGPIWHDEQCQGC